MQTWDTTRGSLVLCGVGASCLALFSWLTPTHALPWTTFHAEFAMALAALLLGLVVFFQTRETAPAIPIYAIFTVVVALVPVVQLAAGQIIFRGDAAMSGLYLSGFACAQIIGFRAVSHFGFERILHSFATVVLIGSGVSVCLAGCQWLQLDYFGLMLSDLPVGGRPFANFNQPNLLATFLLLGTISVAVLYDGGRLDRLFALAAVVLLGLGIAMTQSRGAAIQLLAVSAAVAWRRRLLSRRLGLKEFLTGAGLILLLFVIWPSVLAQFPASPGREVSELMGSGTRPDHWIALCDAIWRQPWFGYGWGQLGIAQFLVAPDHPATGEVLQYGHNILLDLLIWNGIPIGATIIAGTLLWLSWTYSEIRTTQEVLAFASVTALFVHALVEYPLYYAYFLLPVGALMGGLSALTVPRLTIAMPAWLQPAILLFTSVVLAMVALDYIALEKDIDDLRFEQARIFPKGPRHELSDPILLTQLAAFTHFARSSEHVGMGQTELDLMGSVTRRFPSAENLVRYAASLALNDRPAEATSVLQRVCKLNRPSTCEAMKTLWGKLGSQKPKLTLVHWP